MAQILERFENVYKQFFDELNKTFGIKIVNQDNICYLDDFITHILPHMDNISVCNEDFLKLSTQHIHLTHNVSFRHIMENKNYEENKISFWKYLHTLYLLSTKLEDQIVSKNIPNSVKAVLASKDDIMENIKKYKPEEVFAYKSVSTNSNTSKTSKKADEIIEDLKDDDKAGDDIGNIFGGSDGSADFLKNTLIGKLAEDLSKEFNPEEFKDLNNPMDLLGTLLNGGVQGRSGMGQTGIGEGMANILQKVCVKMDEKIKNGELNHEALLLDAQKMMGNMFGAGAGGDANQMRMGGMMGMMNMMNGMVNRNNTNKNSNTNANNKKKVIRRKKK